MHIAERGDLFHSVFGTRVELYALQRLSSGENIHFMYLFSAIHVVQYGEIPLQRTHYRVDIGSDERLRFAGKSVWKVLASLVLSCCEQCTNMS